MTKANRGKTLPFTERKKAKREDREVAKAVDLGHTQRVDRVPGILSSHPQASVECRPPPGSKVGDTLTCGKGGGEEPIRRKGHTRETREGWFLLTVEIELNGDSKSTNEMGP
jgi:hypothetical protein